MVITYVPDNSKVVHITKVDFIKRPTREPLHIVQYDKTIPIMEVYLYLNDEKFVLPESMDVRVRWSKEDRSFIYKDILGCNQTRTSVFFEIDEQMSFFSGIVYPIIELKIINGEDIYKAGSQPIPVVIDPNPILDSDVQSQSQYFDLPKGDPGSEIELNKSDTHLQWRYVGDADWINLIALSEITGPTGNPDIDIEQIRNSFILALKKSYKEILKNNDGQVESIDIWEDDSKLNHLFTKAISYDLEGRAARIDIQDHITGRILTKIILYPDEVTTTITEVIT